MSVFSNAASTSRSTLLLCALLFFGTSPAIAQQSGDPVATSADPDSLADPVPAADATPSSGDPEGDDIGILPGDRIRIQIWREPDLSGTFHVDERGDVVLPKLGPVPVRGLGPAGARERIQDRYSAFLRNPSLEVMVLRRIGVHGEVKAPTLYWLDVTMSVRDAIAVAGGMTPSGDPGKISIVRDGTTIDLEGGETAALVESGLRSGDQIVVDRRSWIALNAPYVISSGISLLGILSGFLLAR